MKRQCQNQDQNIINLRGPKLNFVYKWVKFQLNILSYLLRNSRHQHSSAPHNTSLTIYTQNFQYKILKCEKILKNF